MNGTEQEWKQGTINVLWKIIQLRDDGSLDHSGSIGEDLEVAEFGYT